jgi:tripartite-type tricarboxylate transporter receptor subunit TctC
MHRRTLIQSAVCALLAAAAPARAAFPDKPIKLVTPFPPGGTVGNIAHALSLKLAALLGQPVVIEPRPGAAGTIAAAQVARAPKDGHTLLFATSAMLGIAKYTYQSLPYDPVADFAPVSYLGNVLVGVFSNPKSSGIDSLAALISQARQRPGKINFGSPGVGSASHLAGELFRTRAKLELVHVPYPSATPQMTDLVGGVTELAFGGVSAGMPYTLEGRTKLIAVASPTRSRLFPDVPAIGEMLPGYEGPAWLGVVAPQGTPAEVVERLSAAVQDALRDRDFRQLMETNVVEIEAMSARAFGEKIRREMDLWEEAVRGARLQGSVR